MKQATRFIFQDYHFNREQAQVRFVYRIEFADQSSEEFIEKLSFPPVSQEAYERIPSDLLERVLQMLHLFVGTSYWKMYCPKSIQLEKMKLTREQADFWNTVYTKGLGEFFYKNQIDFRGLVQFPFEEGYQAERALSIEQRHRSLVPFGGGKDSIVTAERLTLHGKEFDLYWMGNFPLLEDLVRSMGRTPLTVKRELDANMIKQSLNGEVTYNGHIPISTLYMLTGVLSCVLFDYEAVILSNELSANFGNIEYLGQEINHQWSKSVEFEQMLQEYLKKFVTPSIQVFSLLRPYHEIEIVRQFVQFPKYLGKFSSCNRNFTVSKSLPQREGMAYWCGTCPKCAFVFALLAAFLPKEPLVEVFGKNLFADADLVPLYRELLGLSEMKPFECVGTPDEVRYAMWRASEGGEYQNDPIMTLFLNEARPRREEIQHWEKELLAAHQTDTIPENFRSSALDPLV